MTATTKDFRAAVFAEVQTWGAANFPAVPIIYENGPVADEDSIGPIWLDVELRWYSGEIATLGETPRMRHGGAVSVMCYFKESKGTEQSDLMLDSLATTLQARRLGGAVLWAPQRTVPSNMLGWYRVGILVPFTLG